MAHSHYHKPGIERYDFDPKLKTVSFILMGVGLLLFVLGVFFNMDYPTRIWTTMLHNTYYFLGLGLLGMFYVAAQTMGYSGWVILVSRIPEAMARVVPVFSAILAAVLVLGYKSIYHWAHEGIMDPASGHYDELIAGKEGFLNPVFFFGATAVYLGLWSLLTLAITNNSYSHDSDPGMKRYTRSRLLSMVFLFVFAISSSTALWHWLMSIDPHWFSTLYGWYCFISLFVGAISTTILIAIYLKDKGYLQNVNVEHFHDLGKWMFAFSVAWAYLWFAQFMLIWYGNIPEETLYFVDRYENYKILFFLNFCINFMLPFLVLMTARAKRSKYVLSFIATMLIFGHWLDYYLLAMPGAVKGAAYVHDGHTIHNFGIGPLEIGYPMIMAGLFMFLVFNTLSKHSLVPVNHPFLRQSYEHHTNSI